MEDKTEIPKGVLKKEAYITISIPNISHEEFAEKLNLGVVTGVMRHLVLENNGTEIHINGTQEDEKLVKLLKYWNSGHESENQWRLKLDGKKTIFKNFITKRLKKKFDVRDVTLLGKGKSINGIRVLYNIENIDAKKNQIQSILKIAGITGNSGSVCSLICDMF